MHQNSGKRQLFQFMAIAVLGLLLAALGAGLARAAEFSADLVSVQGSEVSIGKLFIKNDQMRLELEVDGDLMITICALKSGRTLVLMEGNIYAEVPFADNPVLPLANEYEEQDLGSETVEGYLCTVVRYIYKDKSLGSSTHWLAPELGFPLKVEEVNQKGKTEEITTLTNIRLGPLAQSLFEVPAGFTKMNIPGFPSFSGAQGGQSPGQTTPPGGTNTPEQPGSGTIPGLPGGLPNIPGMPAEAAEMLKNLPGGGSTVPRPPQTYGPKLPEMYRGTFTVLIQGQRQWQTEEVGECGVSYIEHSEDLLEKVFVEVPLILLPVGNIVSAPHKHVTGTVEINYRRYRDGKLEESWSCEEQVFQLPEYCSPCTASYSQYDPTGCYHVYYLGLNMLGSIAEHCGNSGRCEMWEYHGHPIDLAIPVPKSSPALNGGRTLTFGEDDWIEGEFTWEMTPVEYEW